MKARGLLKNKKILSALMLAVALGTGAFSPAVVPVMTGIACQAMGGCEDGAENGN